MDELFICTRGKVRHLWRVVDQHGRTPDILVPSRRSAKLAKRLFCKLLSRLQYVPRVIVTDKLTSYAATKRETLPDVEHRQGRYLKPSPCQPC